MTAIAVVAPMVTRRKKRVPMGIMLCFGFVLVVVLAAFVGPHFLTRTANTPDPFNLGATPTAGHWLGTDELGRDVFARLVIGAYSALIGPFIIALSGLIVSGFVGIAAGYLGGLTDMVTMRVVDFMIALPGLLLTIVLVTVVQGGYWVAVLVLSVLNVQGDIRLVRGATLAQRSLAYVEAARVVGISRFSIMYRHIARNVITILLANCAIDFAGALVALAGLSFLGLGAQPPQIDWGGMLENANQGVFQSASGVVFPAVAIVLLVVSLNFIADWALDFRSRRSEQR